MTKRLLIILVAYGFLNLANGFAQEEESPWYEYYDVISYSELRALIDGGEIEEARILNDGWWVTVRRKDGEYFDVRVTPQTPVADHLYDAGIPVSIEHSSKDEDDEQRLWLDVLISLSPLALLIVFLMAIVFVSRKQTKAHYHRAERAQTEFFERLEKILAEHKAGNG